MKTQAFVFNWKGHERNALALEAKIAPHIKVTVINSEEGLSSRRPGWIHLDDTAYFSAQWNKAVELFDADIFFHIQADVEFDNFEALFPRVASLWNKYNVGVYEPDIQVSIPWFRYDNLKLRSLEPNVFEIPMSDSTCWFISGDIVRKLPFIDTSLNKYGWGISAAIAGLSRLNGRKCVRDHSFTFRHRTGRGYASEVAGRQRDAYINSLYLELRRETLELDQLRRSVRQGLHGRLWHVISRAKMVGPAARKLAALSRRLGYLQDRR